MSDTTALDWEARYRSGQTGWQRGDVNPVCQAWIAGGSLGRGRILVPGAGRSLEPAALAQAGFHVTVIDIAPSAIAFQAEALAPAGGSAVAADLFAWTPADKFDAIYDQTCLCALPPALWPDYAARLATWLRPGGVLGALFLQTGREGGPPFHCDLMAMQALFSPPLWRWPDNTPQAVPQFGGLSEIPALLTRVGG